MTRKDEADLEAFEALQKETRKEIDALYMAGVVQTRRLLVEERRNRRLMILCGVLAILAAWGWAR